MTNNDKFRSDKTPLKPCPFCGGEAMSWKQPDYSSCGCKLCGSKIYRSHYGGGIEEAIKAWNRRCEDRYTKEEIEDEFGRYRHDMAHPTHSKKQGHFCHDFDGLWICSDCGEFACCRCFEMED